MYLLPACLKLSGVHQVAIPNLPEHSPMRRKREKERETLQEAMEENTCLG